MGVVIPFPTCARSASAAEAEARTYFRLCRFLFDAALAVDDYREAMQQAEDVLAYPLRPDISGGRLVRRARQTRLADDPARLRALRRRQGLPASRSSRRAKHRLPIPPDFGDRVMTMTVAAEPCPRTPTQEQYRSIADTLLDSLIERGLKSTAEREASSCDIARVISKLGPFADGYTIARQLEERSGWDCDLQIAAALDDFSELRAIEVRRLRAEWAARNDVKPQFAIGSRVSFGPAMLEKGEITGVSKYTPAAYEIAVDGDASAGEPHNRRRIVHFEDVAPIDAADHAAPAEGAR